MDDVSLVSSDLEVTVSPDFGGGITSIRIRGTDTEVLWQPMWARPPRLPAIDRPLGIDEWLAHSRGGWQVMIPNAGDACEWRGVQHGFHGESSVARWSAAQPPNGADSLTLSVALASLPLDVSRTVVVTGNEVSVTETVMNRSDAQVSFMWLHHPSLGGSILEGATLLDTNARRVRVDDRLQPVGVPIPVGSVGDWPVVAGHDLTKPVDGTLLLSYLSDFDGSPWVSVRRADDSLGIRIDWDGGALPYCWLWEELGGGTGEPWRGRERVIGLEPSSSRPGQGLAVAETTTGETVTLRGRASVTCTVKLHVLH